MKKKFFLLLIVFIFSTSIEAYTKAPVDLTTMNIYEIQEAVDRGLINYETIVKIYLERIEEYNAKYNAVLFINENALEEAKELDKEYKESGRRSLVFGLPILVKDNIDVKGLPTTAGYKTLKDNLPIDNAPVVQKLIDAGAIIIAKTNMSMFAISATASYSNYGHVKNAYDTLYSPYGSSGGSAVSVAANFAVAALGTDTGCSVRLPSSANNLVGLRPTYNTVNANGVIKLESTRDVVGPITRFVEDNAIMLEIIDDTDKSYQIKEASSLEGVRIGVVKSFIKVNTTSTSTDLGKTDKDVYDLFMKTVDKLEELGAEIVDLSYFPSHYIWYDTICYDFNQYIKGTTGPITSSANLGTYLGSSCNTDYTKTSSFKTYLSQRDDSIGRANAVYKNNNLDVVIYPTLKTKVTKLSDLSSYKLYTPSSSTAPLLGFPSMNLQMGFIDNLPYGFEIMAQTNNESIIYQIAYNYEKATNYYVNPSISPNLYEIPENLNVVLDYLNETSAEAEYVDVKNQVKELLNNYNDVEDLDAKINEIIENYKNVPNLINERKAAKVENKEITNQTNKIIIIVIILFLSIITYLLESKRKGRKNVFQKKHK